MQDFKSDFLELAIDRKVMLFGEFKTKAGRQSPYFFNAGQFSDGASLKKLGEFYAKAILASGLAFDGLFGPAYKGIPLVTTVAVALAADGRSVPVTYNRKEAKDHGEGGTLVGAPLQGNILIVDDVISAGTSVRESIAMIAGAGATPCGVAIALDRQERAAEGGRDLPWSAVQYVAKELKLEVAAIATLDDLLRYLSTSEDTHLKRYAGPVQAYRDRYGV